MGNEKAGLGVESEDDVAAGFPNMFEALCCVPAD